MSDRWSNYDPENSKGPFSYGLRIIILVVALSAVVGVIGYVGGWFGEAAKVTQEQFGPQALLQKYEWFKDASAQLDAKVANIQAMEQRQADLTAQYQGQPRNKWLRSDAEQYNQTAAEIAGLKANYNDLAAEYNSAMSKFNYRFTNVGDLPQGATKVLPREYKPYVS
jgi:hypothetical protein